MRQLSVIVVGLAVAIVIVTWLERSGSEDRSLKLPFTNRIRVTGPGNTLASIAQQVNDPQQFRYDPETRIAVSYATLIVEGELQLGREGEPESAESLEMATAVCGDLRIKVQSGGELRLYHSTIRTVSQVLSNTACSRGYALFVDGTLTMDQSRMAYLSGTMSQCLRRDSQATIRGSTFSQCDGSALSCINVDGRRIVIEESVILGSGAWGLVVQGRGGAPLEIHHSTLDGRVGAVFLTGQDPHVRLVDCSFDRSKIVFNGPSGQVDIAWTRRFRVIDGMTESPRAGVFVRATCTSDDDPRAIVEGTTDADGTAELTLIEKSVRPRTGREDPAESALHQVSVVGPDGEVLATMDGLSVRGKRRDLIVIELR